MKHTLEDHIGRHVSLPIFPRKIVSLCPSVTETLFSLVAPNRIIGRTHFCVHPPHQTTPFIGGTKNVDIERIAALQPDCIFAVKEENTQQTVEALEDKFPVVVLDVEKIESAHAMLQDIGRIVGASEEAQTLSDAIQKRWKSLEGRGGGKTCLYMIWREPNMFVGNATYIHDVLSFLGFINLGQDFEGRYPSLTEGELRSLLPDILFLSSEPFPFTNKHIPFFQSLFPHADIRLVDGEFFSWYGTRMLHAAAYFEKEFSPLQ